MYKKADNNLDKIPVLLFLQKKYMINTSDVFAQKTREKHNLKKIAVKRSDVFEENETSDELRRRKQKNIHLSIKNHKAIRISIVTTIYES